MLVFKVHNQNSCVQNYNNKIKPAKIKTTHLTKNINI